MVVAAAAVVVAVDCCVSGGVSCVVRARQRQFPSTVIHILAGSSTSTDTLNMCLVAAVTLPFTCVLRSPAPPFRVLPQAPLGDSGGLDVLAARYNHDAKALDQVCERERVGFGEGRKHLKGLVVSEAPQRDVILLVAATAPGSITELFLVWSSQPGLIHTTPPSLVPSHSLTSLLLPTPHTLCTTPNNTPSPTPSLYRCSGTS